MITEQEHNNLKCVRGRKGGIEKGALFYVKTSFGQILKLFKNHIMVFRSFSLASGEKNIPRPETLINHIGEK